MAHALEHPSHSEAHDVGAIGLIADNFVSQLNVQPLHSRYEEVLRGHHERKFSSKILEVVEVKENCSLDVRFLKINSLVVARLPPPRH